MKKFLLFLFCFLVFASNTFAVSATDKKVNLSDYNTMNFTQILDSEKIEKSFKDYKETNDQVIIYLFRGDGCAYCRAFLTFLASITDEYGKYFRVIGFETWSDSANSTLLKNISNFLEEPAGGVPYIIIGDQVIPGYTSTYDDTIKNAIMSEYNSNQRYDVIEEYNKAIDQAQKEVNGNASTIIFWNFLITIGASIVIIMYVNKQNKKIIDLLEKKGRR